MQSYRDNGFLSIHRVASESSRIFLNRAFSFSCECCMHFQRGLSHVRGLFLLLSFFIASTYCHAEKAWHQIAGWEYEFMRVLHTPPAWMLEQIHRDLSAVQPSQASREAIEHFMQEFENKSEGLLLVRIIIHSNRIFIRQCIPLSACGTETHRYRLEWVLQGFTRLARCITLPNVDLVMCLYDSFDVDLPIPVFGFAKNPSLAPKTILIPDFEALMGNESFLYAVYLANQWHPWSRKKNQAVFRGSLTGGDYNHANFLQFPRSKAITQGLQHPHLIDAKFTYYPGWEGYKAQFGDYFSPPMSVQDHITYKYQLLIDGNSCAYSRAYWQLFSNCVILKQASDNIQWYYGGFEPYVHFIPVHSDMSNLPEIIKWTMEHDAEAQAISRAAQEFAKNNISYAHIMQYLYLTLIEYAALQTNSF